MHLEDGICPHCHQTVKTYSRSIYKGMWRALRLIGDSAHGADAHTIMTTTYCGDYAKLAYWGLVYQDTAKVWHITDKGRQLLNGELSIPKYAYVYNGNVVGFSAETVTAAECRKKFDLAEVMDPANLAA